MLKNTVSINYSNAGNQVLRKNAFMPDIVDEVLRLCSTERFSTGTFNQHGAIAQYLSGQSRIADITIIAPLKGTYSVHIKFVFASTSVSPSWPSQWVAKLGGQIADDVGITGPVSNEWTIWVRFNDIELNEWENTLSLEIDPSSMGTGSVRAEGVGIPVVAGKYGLMYSLGSWSSISFPRFPWLSDYAPPPSP